MTKTNFAAGQLRSFIDRIMRLKAEQDDLGTDIREVYKEAHTTGFDKNILGQVVQRLRKEEKNGSDRVQEADAMLELYLDTYKGGFEDGEGNHTGEPAEPAQRAPEPRRGASKQKPLTHAGAREGEEPTPEPHPVGSVSKAGEGTAAAPSSPASSYYPMTGEIDPGPMPGFLKRKQTEAAA